MGYLESIIQDARRQGMAVFTAPLPGQEWPWPEAALVNADAADGEALDGSGMSPPAESQAGSVPIPSPPVPAQAPPVKGLVQLKAYQPDGSPPVIQPFSASINAKPLPPQAPMSTWPAQEEAQGLSVVARTARAASPAGRSLSATRREVSLPAKLIDDAEDLPSSPSHRLSPRVPVVAAPPVPWTEGRSPIANVGHATRKAAPPQPDGHAENGRPATIEATSGRCEDLAVAEQPAAIAPFLPSAAREFPQGREASFPVGGNRQARQTLAGTIAARTWASEKAPAVRATHTKAVEQPRVHIGRIEVVILAPEPARPGSSSAPLTGGLVNRQYLRRL